MPDGAAPLASSSILECVGDPREMGLAQGAFCKPALDKLSEAALSLLGLSGEGVLGRVASRLSPALLTVAGAVSRRALERDFATHYPAQLARIQGIAAGAGLPLRELFAGPGVEVWLDTVSYRAPGACTAVGATGRRSAGGEAIIVKNFDYPRAAQDQYLTRVSRPRVGASSIDVTAAPVPGSHEGVNERGLAIAYNYGYFAGTAAARVTITTLVQEMLEECATVADVIERLRRRPRTGAAMLMVADAEGALASIEVSPDDLSVRHAGDHGDVLVNANHAITEKMVPRDIPHDVVFSRWNPAVLRGKRVHASSEQRQARGDALMAGSKVMTEADVVAVGRDHGPHGRADDTICRHGEYYTTTCSVVLLPKQRTLRWVFDAPCCAPYQSLTL
jgi:predicted choloylglycine hydrolase